MSSIQRTFNILIQKPNQFNNLFNVYLGTVQERTPLEAVKYVLNHFSGMEKMTINKFTGYSPYGVTVTEFNVNTKKVLHTFQYTLNYPKEKW